MRSPNLPGAPVYDESGLGGSARRRGRLPGSRLPVPQEPDALGAEPETAGFRLKPPRGLDERPVRQVRAARSVSARPRESELDAVENRLQLVGGELPVPLERVVALPDLTERAAR